MYAQSKKSGAFALLLHPDFEFVNVNLQVVKAVQGVLFVPSKHDL
jgi:hypothetical protein